MTRTYATAFLAGMTSLALELLLIRLLAFFLTSATDFLAIPLALLGLALGSMYAHFGWRGSAERLVSLASAAVLPTVVGALLVLFATFDLVFYKVHVFLSAIGPDSVRLVVYSLILLPPFAVFGALFAGLFSGNHQNLGRLYAADLAGAAFGCLLAPVLLTISGLPAALLGVVLGALLLLLVDPERSRRAQLAGGGLFVLVLVGVVTGVLFREQPDPVTLARSVMLSGKEPPVVDILRVRWNEIARTALVRIKRDARTGYFVVQDNGLSNVTLQAWPPSETTAEGGVHDLAWKIGRGPDKVLVMFAGAGRDMMNFDLLSDGKADITGVELNPAVRMLGEAVEKLKIGEFLQKPNVHLVIQEGRDFLDHDQGVYDEIYVANNGAVYASRTGHTRKYLDTREAMAAYLDHLAPEGVMVFVNQPVAEKITSFRALFAERGLGDFAKAAFVYGRKDTPELQTLVVAKNGFTEAEVPQLEVEAKSTKNPVLYRPGDPVETLDALGTARLVTDDRPFTRSLQLALLGFDPSAHQRDLSYISSWVKVFTVVLFTILSVVAGGIVLSFGHGSGRVPFPWIAYLWVTGIGYMCVEIGLVARTELFVGNPLYAVALNLAVFLVSSAAGSYASERRTAGPLELAIGAAVAVGWGLLATHYVTAWFLSVPLVLKAVLVAVAVGPAGFALGMFYPFAVSRLTAEGRAMAVPATYALTTLSSVLGSAFATTAMIDLGFVRVIVLGAMAYLVAGAIGWWRTARSATTPV
jgi:hypothetical protein